MQEKSFGTILPTNQAVQEAYEEGRKLQNLKGIKEFDRMWEKTEMVKKKES